MAAQLHCLVPYVEGDRLWRTGAYVYSIEGFKVIVCIPYDTRECVLTDINQLYYDYASGHENVELLLEIS